MLSRIKGILQNRKIEQCRRELAAEVAGYGYRQWIRYEEKQAGEADSDSGRDQKNAEKRTLPTVSVIGFDELCKTASSDHTGAAIVILEDRARGHISERALIRIRTLFAEHGDWDMIYGDEDFCFRKNRLSPWMKPDFSPDTLLAFPYFGGCIAFRKERFSQVERRQGSDVQVYDFLLRCAETDRRIVHVPEVFFHRKISQEQYRAYSALDRTDPVLMTADDCMPWKQPWEDQERFREVRMAAMERRGYPGTLQKDAFGVLQCVYDVQADEEGKLPLVSILIPSKDQVDVLERCLRSIRAHEGYREYEILVIDNGSSEENRARLTKLREELDFAYFYEPMEFNFSAMINAGARMAKGDYLLLLNDDCEVIMDDWLKIMLGQAQLPHVGAVGAKLLYPDSDLIQHAGVTNMTAGPAHKLQQNSDSHSYYFGKNRFCGDCIAVTAACLMVSGEKFAAVGGFFEGLKVAFNDVDFCFSLFERGLYQVMRNDVVLYHHESLSRGNDLLSEEKTRRLTHERDVLYARHPLLSGKDPFYSVNLTGYLSDYVLKDRLETERGAVYTQISPKPMKVRPEWYNESVMITLESVGKADFGKSGEAVYGIRGWAYVLGQDNCRYRLSILLKGKDGAFYAVQVFRCYRPDAVKVLREQKNIEMSGFTAAWPQGALAPGEYGIFVLMKDRCSRQRLLRDSGEVLLVDK